MSLPPSDNGHRGELNFNSKENILEAIVECVRHNDKDILRCLLAICKKHPFPPPADYEDTPYEETPLHVAASKPEYKEYLELLLEYSDSLRLNIDDMSYNSETALHLACLNGCDESVLILLQNQCDVNKSLRYGDSALHLAADEGHLKITQYLLDYGANIHKANRYGSTPLHKAASSGRLEVARLLLEKGAKICASNGENEIPLFLACRRNDYNMIQLLVEHGSRTLNLSNYSEVTPIMVATEKSPNERCVRLLHENGASFKYRDCEGRLALHYAAKNGNVEVLQYVLEHTDASSIKQCFEDIPSLLRKWTSFDSLICCAIDSGNIECLQMLLSSNKLPRSILQAPRLIGPYRNSYYKVYSPLSFLFSDSVTFTNEKLDLYLRILLEHKLMTLDEFVGNLKTKFPFHLKYFHSPFSGVFSSTWPSSQQQYYFHWLHTNGISIDYCLQWFRDNTRPFASFDDYQHFYEPVLMLILDCNMDALQLIMSTSAILEPDKLIAQLNKLVGDDMPYDDSTFQCHVSRRITFLNKGTDSLEEHCNIYKYLISLKPIFHTHAQLYHSSAQNNKWFPCYIPNAGQELAESTLKQLCRTTIRQHLRKDTLEDNLRDFRRNISELPLPPVLIDYLLFKN